MIHSCLYTSHQNEKVERKHRYIVETGFTFLSQVGLSLKFWWDSFETSTCLINRLSTTILNFDSPFERLFHRKPDYSFLKTFGCACYPYLRPYNQMHIYKIHLTA